MYWPQDDGSRTPEAVAEEDHEVLDARVLKFFDGNKVHATRGFYGVRYALIFFFVKNAWKASVATQRALCQQGALCNAWEVQSI